jgi:thiol-disulfide isomerase/thioredoxin
MESFVIRNAFLTLALLSSAAASTADAQEAGIAVGTMAPSALVQTLDGRSLDLSSYLNQGKVVVLEFWATWCPLCRQMEPQMQAARTKYAAQATFVSVGVSANQTPARQKAYAEANAIGGELVFDRDDFAIKAFSVPHTSYVVVLNAEGRVMYTGVGPQQNIDAAVQQGLKR